MGAGRWLLSGVVTVLVGAVGAGGWKIYEQDARVNDLEASVESVRGEASATAETSVAQQEGVDEALVTLLGLLDVQQGINEPYVSARLDRIEDQLGYSGSHPPLGDGALPDIETQVGDVEARVVRLESDVNYLCSILLANGLGVAC